MKADGTENPFKLWRELGELMTKNCTVIRYNKNLQQTDAEAVRAAGALPPHQPERSDPVGQHHRSSSRASSTTCCNWRA